MSYVIPILVALAGSGIWTALFDYLKQRRNKLSVEQKMLLGLAHDVLYKRLEYYLARGYVTVDELENLEYMFVPYKQLHGNGTCERLYEAVYQLPHERKVETYAKVQTKETDGNK